MATVYVAGPGSENPANPVRAVASPFRRATMTSKGLIADGVYHAQSLVSTRKAPSGDVLLAVDRRIPNRRGWQTPDDFGEQIDV